MFKYLFGPVPSRRLGVSLGIDITPAKHCTFNCVYCECGKTDFLTDERGVYAPTAEVIRELRQYLSLAPALDSITFSGSGEPTLHEGLGVIITALKQEFPAYRVTVLTNSSLLWMPEVRDALARADLVVPSLDAVSETVFQRINRPVRTMTSAMLIDGLREFCRESAGMKWLEVFIVPGVNDTDDELGLFRDTIRSLDVDKVQLNTLDRPGAVPWITPAPYERLEEIAAFLGGEIEIVASHRMPASAPRGPIRLRDLILSTVQVRPCTIDDLESTLGATAGEIAAHLRTLMEEDLVETKRASRGTFYLARVGKHLTH